MTENTVSSLMPQVPFKLLPPHWSSQRVSPSKSVCGPFKRDCLGLQKPFLSLSLNLHWFIQPEVMGTSLPGTGILAWRAWCWAGTPHNSGWTFADKKSFPIFICHMWVWDQTILGLCPSYQSWCSLFNSPGVGFLFSQILGHSEGWFFYTLFVILL